MSVNVQHRSRFLMWHVKNWNWPAFWSPNSVVECLLTQNRVPPKICVLSFVFFDVLVVTLQLTRKWRRDDFLTLFITGVVLVFLHLRALWRCVYENSGHAWSRQAYFYGKCCSQTIEWFADQFFSKRLFFMTIFLPVLPIYVSRNQTLLYIEKPRWSRFLLVFPL